MSATEPGLFQVVAGTPSDEELAALAAVLAAPAVHGDGGRRLAFLLAHRAQSPPARTGGLAEHFPAVNDEPIGAARSDGAVH